MGMPNPICRMYDAPVGSNQASPRSAEVVEW